MLVLHDYEFLSETEASVIARACLRAALKIKIAKEGKATMLTALGLFSETRFSDKLTENIPTADPRLEATATKRVEEVYMKFEDLFPGVKNLRQLCKDVLPEKMLSRC